MSTSTKGIDEDAKKVVDLFRDVFGFILVLELARSFHAKGILLQGTFRPTPEASSLSTAPHFRRHSTSVIARLSNSGGVPTQLDADPANNQNGLALRFLLSSFPRREKTDIATVSTPFFPAGNVPDGVGFFRALATYKVEEFIRTHPAAAAFINAPKPFPASFATQQFFSINAFKFVGKDHKETYIRYRIMPKDGVFHLDEKEAASKPPNYLCDELVKKLETGPIEYELLAQIAEAGDVTDDCTVHWPETRKLVKLGVVSLESILPDSDEEQKNLQFFDPVPRVEGIETSGDPLIDLRSVAYRFSGADRRAA
ncbi:unnamed protein product [Clonostachys rhizophaga]|uniref:Catalase core domain-containing protein n=1 Tax=Clonostachys rhizophaga TaxID=160324 RepID=A0A9N9YMW4_9HYPO|nr:unnamed protein product [Clonostachys rhizophaga]